MARTTKSAGDNARGLEKTQGPTWFALDPAKRECERFFLWYSVAWVTFFGFIVVSKVYETFGPNEYMAVGLILMLPPMIISVFFPGLIGKTEAATYWTKRYSVQANAWIFGFSFIGNYFWTHYFYSLLGAVYTMQAHRLNDVPIFLIACTHAYFIFYHTLSTLLLRRIAQWHWTMWWMVILIMSYITAFMETWTIASFPYYSFKDRTAMYVYGSVFYALYFVVSFPMYYRFREGLGEAVHWSLERATVDGLGAAMIVTCLLDFWRLAIGNISGESALRNFVPFIEPGQ